MFLRLLFFFILVLSFSGCATTSKKMETEQLQSRVTDLEKKTGSQDSQIVDLQYQVKDLSSKVQAPSNTAASSNVLAQEVSSSAGTSKVSSKASGKGIIRVKASGEDVQTALKAAGVYTGSIDGKIGAATQNAIVEFQKSHGLKADGILGKKTWEELKTYLK